MEPPDFSLFPLHLLHRRIDVKGNDIRPTNIFGIILAVIASDSASDVIVPSNTLSQVEEHRAVWIRLPNPLVVTNNRFRQDS